MGFIRQSPTAGSDAGPRADQELTAARCCT